MTAASRRGATLPGVLVGLALTAVVLATLGNAAVTLLRQAHRQHDRTQARAQLAQAAGVLAAELRGAASVATATDVADLLLVADSAVELRAPVGGGAACAVGPDALELLDAPIDGAPPVAWWHDAPQPEDVVHLLDEGATPRVADDAWHARTIVAVSRGGGACAAGPYAAWRGAGAALLLRLDGPPLPATLGAGAPVRVTRRRRYVLYRAADDGWQLGQRVWTGGVGTLQPVAGPLAAFGAVDAGLSVVALDAAGTPVSGAPPGGPVARLSLIVRAERRWAGRRWTDSAVAHVPVGAGATP